MLNLVLWLYHNAAHVISGVFIWITTFLAFKLPTLPLLLFTLTSLNFNIVNFIPWLQGVVLCLGGLVSLLTLYKLAIDVKWLKKKK